MSTTSSPYYPPRARWYSRCLDPWYALKTHWNLQLSLPEGVSLWKLLLAGLLPGAGFWLAEYRLLAKIAPRVQIPLGSPLGSLSHDPAWLEATKADPLFTRTLSAGIAIEFLKTSEWILSQTSFPPLPLLIMQGTADQHVDPKTNIEFAGRLKGDVTLKVWEGLGHELHNEVSRAEVLAFVKGWIDARVK